jgi:hypothetical protein
MQDVSAHIPFLWSCDNESLGRSKWLNTNGGGEAVICMEDKQWTHKSSQLRMSAKNTILSPVTPKSDNDVVNCGMGGESKSVNNTLLILDR